MRRAGAIALFFIFVCFVGIPFGLADGTVYLEGPDERGEGLLPPAAGSEPGLFGEFTVDIYAEDMPGFAGFQIQLDLPYPTYMVAYNNFPPDSGAAWGDRKIVYNSDFLPEIEEITEGQTVGLISMEREFIPPATYGDYIDKSIPAEEDIDPETSQPYGRTWLMSVTYWYGSDASPGPHTLDVVGELTVFGDCRTEPPTEIPYIVVAGGFTISDDVTPPEPDPMTWGVEPDAATATSISMTATSAADPAGVEYYFEETSHNPGGSDSGWQDSPEYEDTGLALGTTYTYRVKARDKSPNQNETAYSNPSSATTFSPKITIEGPNQRGEGPLPPAEGTLPGELGEFAIKIYAEDMPGFAGFQIQLDLAYPAFMIAFNNDPPDSGAAWGDRKIVHNSDFLPDIEEICDGQTVGLISMEREWLGPPVNDWGDYVDKSIPAADDIDPETGQPYGPTLLMTITYWYNSDVGPGTYAIGVNEELTAFGDTRPDPPVEIPYTLVAGSVTISPDLTPPEPDPMTWEVEPNATTPTSIAMIASTATDTNGVEYYFEETSGNPGGSDSGWQDSPEYEDTGLSPGTTYTYTVKARDKSSEHNETACSDPASAETPSPKLTLEGPGERSEGRMPPARGSEPGQFGEFTVDIYAEDVPGFAGFQTMLEFVDRLMVAQPGFYVAYNHMPPDPEPGDLWGDRKIVHNEEFLPEIQHACEGEAVGFISMEREWFGPPINDWGDYVDKSIPAADEIDPETGQPYGRTWLMSVTYWYTRDVPSGTYTIDVDEEFTVLGDNRPDPPVEVPYTLVPGSFTIGWYIPGDVTGDCVVNILDLISVRNRLNQDVDTGNNWEADLTGDGKINVLDMIYVRNSLYTTCD